MSAPWSEVRFTFPPGSDTDRILLGWAEANGFHVTDWCDWRREDGAVLSIAPVPPPEREASDG